MNSPWFYRPFPRPQPSARLFAFPYAGAGPAVFRAWPDGLPSTVELCAVQLPGRGARFLEPAIPSIPRLTGALLPALMPLLDRPFAFFGHSMGAVLAFEAARALVLRGGPVPALVIVSARRAPHIPDPGPPLHNLPDAEFAAEINRRYGGIPAEILDDKEALEFFLPVLRADISALDAYRPAEGIALCCPLAVFGGEDDARIPLPHLEAWRGVTSGPFEICLFPGGHFYFDREPHRRAVLAKISKMLAPLSGVA
ncbi:MAG TPA: alpha/beta fold hydrolase [Methylocella sp.]|nr:alpha/beta fold hydrolase [Methylocella sp.]